MSTAEQEVAVEAPKKRVAKKSGTKKTAKKGTKKSVKKSTKKTAKNGETRNKALADNQIATLKALKGTSVTGKHYTKGELRKMTGNQYLGLPNLEKRGYVVSSVDEEKRGHVYSITAEGQKASRKS